MDWSVIGHERQKKYFEGAISRGLFSHAYLFSGADAIGKCAFALELVRRVNDRCGAPLEHDQDIKYIAPLALDERCSAFINFVPHRLERTETEIYIEDITGEGGVQSFLNSAPLFGPRMWVIINEADRIAREAGQALLKSLEEARPYVTFILISARPGLLPETVRSRCLELRFMPPRETEVREFLVGRKVPAGQREPLVSLAAGAIGWLSAVIDGKRTAEVIDAGGDLHKHLEQGITERLAWAKKLSDHDDVRDMILRWLNLSRTDLTGRPDAVRMVRGLLELYDVLGQSKYNARLALEHFVLSA